MSDRIQNTIGGLGNSALMGICCGAAVIVMGCAHLVRMGYAFGVAQSEKVLRQHHKDTKVMEKREKIFFRKTGVINKRGET